MATAISVAHLAAQAHLHTNTSSECQIDSEKLYTFGFVRNRTMLNRQSLYIALTLTSTCLAFQASRDLRGEKVVYEGETLVIRDAQHGINLYAGAKTIVAYDSNGLPEIVSFDINGRVQGAYGVDGNGLPTNKGRLIYKQANPNLALPYQALGAKDLYTYHLRSLELTTVQNAAKEYRPYITKAVAFDNKVEVTGKPSITYKIPDGGQLVIVNGKIKFGDVLVSPGSNYDLSGKMQ